MSLQTKEPTKAAMWIGERHPILASLVCLLFGGAICLLAFIWTVDPKAPTGLKILLGTLYSSLAVFAGFIPSIATRVGRERG